MEQLTVYLHKDLQRDMAMDTIACYLRQAERQVLSYAPWRAFPYKPQVSFALQYGRDCLCLQFVVHEKFIKALYHCTNDPVYKDSCVEFFISFDDSACYYNLEFNCIGTVLGEYGQERANRSQLAECLLHRIKTQSIIKKDAKRGEVEWELMVVIPFEVFSYHSLTTLQGKTCRTNFYKCGDDLPEPHFLAWSAIESPEPDFHLLHFFGAVHFL